MPARGDEILAWARAVTTLLHSLIPRDSADLLPRVDRTGTTYVLRRQKKETDSESGEGVFVESLGDGTPVLVDSGGEQVDTVQGYSLKSLNTDRLQIAFNSEEQVIEFDPIAGEGDIDVNLESIEEENVGYILVEPFDPNYLAGYSQHRSLAGAPGMEIETRFTDILIGAALSNVGGGEAIYDGVNPEDNFHRFRTITSTNDTIAIEPNGDDELDLRGPILVNDGDGVPILIEEGDLAYVEGYAAWRTLESGDGATVGMRAGAVVGIHRCGRG